MSTREATRSAAWCSAERWRYGSNYDIDLAVSEGGLANWQTPPVLAELVVIRACLRPDGADLRLMTTS